MSRFDSATRLTVKPAPNVYTVMAIISFLAVATAMGYAIYQWNVLAK